MTATMTEAATLAPAEPITDPALPLLEAVYSATVMSVDAAVEKFGTKPLELAWLRGDIEFGRVVRIVTGGPKASMLLFEVTAATDWSGKRTPNHTSFTALYSESQQLPDVRSFAKYITVKDAETGESRLEMKAISKEEAQQLLKLSVRATEAGIEKIMKPAPVDAGTAMASLAKALQELLAKGSR